MASGVADGKQRFPGKKGEGLTLKQFELMAGGSLRDRFKKLQKDVGNPTEGAGFAFIWGSSWTAQAGPRARI
jgi:hypothetical protein